MKCCFCYISSILEYLTEVNWCEGSASAIRLTNRDLFVCHIAGEDLKTQIFKLLYDLWLSDQVTVCCFALVAADLYLDFVYITCLLVWNILFTLNIQYLWLFPWHNWRTKINLSVGIKATLQRAFDIASLYRKHSIPLMLHNNYICIRNKSYIGQR